MHLLKRGVYYGREGSILGGSHIVIEKGVYSGRRGTFWEPKTLQIITIKGVDPAREERFLEPP